MNRPNTIRDKAFLHGLRSRRSKVLFILIFTLLHMLLTALFFFWSFSVVMANSDADQPLPVAGKILVGISDGFQWPLIISLARNEFLRNVLPNYSVYIMVLLNSLLWAFAALGILLWVNRIRHSKR